MSLLMSRLKRCEEIYLKRRKEALFLVVYDKGENKYHNGKEYSPQEWEEFLKENIGANIVRVIYLPKIKQ